MMTTDLAEFSNATTIGLAQFHDTVLDRRDLRKVLSEKSEIYTGTDLRSLTHGPPPQYSFERDKMSQDFVQVYSNGQQCRWSISTYTASG